MNTVLEYQAAHVELQLAGREDELKEEGDGEDAQNVGAHGEQEGKGVVAPTGDGERHPHTQGGRDGAENGQADAELGRLEGDIPDDEGQHGGDEEDRHHAEGQAAELLGRVQRLLGVERQAADEEHDDVVDRLNDSDAPQKLPRSHHRSRVGCGQRDNQDEEEPDGQKIGDKECFKSLKLCC